MKNNRGVSLIEIIISIALLSLVMLFLFRLLIMVRNEDNLNLNKLNVNTISSLLLKEIHDDINSKGIKYVFKPYCFSNDDCCCSPNSDDCLKFGFKTGEIRELSIYETDSFNDTIEYGDIKRSLPNNYSFLSYLDYDEFTENKFVFDEMGTDETTGECQFSSAPPGFGYDADALFIINIPIYRLNVENGGIDIRDGYNCRYIQLELGTIDGSLIRDVCPF